jgi:hypothetical protein
VSIEFTPTFSGLGIHHLHATWNGTTITAPSTSGELDLQIVKNAVHAVDIGPDLSTFYPVADGYLDNVTVEGLSNESVAVAVTITNETTQDVVWRHSLSTNEIEVYSFVWDGRYDPGPPYAVADHRGSLVVHPVVPAGKYRITQVVTDAFGAQLTFADVVTVSAKRLYWYTKSVTLAGDHVTASGGFHGSVSLHSAYSGGLRISIPGGTGGFWEAVGYQFTLPSATEYSALSFAVKGKGTIGAALGLQNRLLGTWPAGHAWVVDDFDLAALPGRYGWTTFVGDPANDRVGRTVRGTVLLSAEPAESYDIAQVKLTYRYGILK